MSFDYDKDYDKSDKDIRKDRWAKKKAFKIKKDKDNKQHSKKSVYEDEDDSELYTDIEREQDLDDGDVW
jgi:hypothetical protein